MTPSCAPPGRRPPPGRRRPCRACCACAADRVSATLRWIGVDLRARRGQALTVVAVVAGVVIALLLSAALLQGATNPWQGLFSASNGAQIWLRLAPGSDIDA